MSKDEQRKDLLSFSFDDTQEQFVSFFLFLLSNLSLYVVVIIIV